MEHQKNSTQIRRQHDDWDEVHNQLLAVQKKSLEISDPNDPSENEADEVARKVVDGQSVQIHGTGGSINRKEDPGDGGPQEQKSLKKTATEGILAGAFVPWEGDISKEPTAPLLKAAKTTAPVLENLKYGEQIQVIGENGDYYNVKHKEIEGFILKASIRQSVLSFIQNKMVGNTYYWLGSKMGTVPGSKDAEHPNGRPMSIPMSSFTAYVLGIKGFGKPSISSGQQVPKPGSTTGETLISYVSMNCWEMILLAALESGHVDLSWLTKIYSSPLPDNIKNKLLKDKMDPIYHEGELEANSWHTKLVVNSLSASPAKAYNPNDKINGLPKAGDIVFFNSTSHISLATGNFTYNKTNKTYKTEVLSFWPPPMMTDFTEKGTQMIIQKTTIEDLNPAVLNSMRKTEPTAKKVPVTFATPPWSTKKMK